MTGKERENLKIVQKYPKTLPAYQEDLERIKSMLKTVGSLAVLFVDAGWLSRIEQQFGRKIYGQVLESLIGLLLAMRGKEIRGEDLVSVYGIEGEQFLIFLSRKREDRGFYSSDLESLAQRVSAHLNRELLKTVHLLIMVRPKITVGHAIALYNPLIQEERQIYKLLEDAKQMARYQRFRHEMKNKEKIQELILKESITTHFQPIVSIEDFNVLGFETLSRGPAGTEYEAPSHLFEMAHEADLGFELDRVCRRKAFSSASSVHPDHSLFVNCLASAVHDPDFRGGALDPLLAGREWNPSRIVMEISERDAIRNYEMFRRAADTYRGMGFGIAVDDIGTGYSSLETVVELCPDFMKLDISMVRKIDRNLIKQELIQAILRLAGSMNSKVIAEGIETQEELETLARLKVPYGQGFFIGQPGPNPIEPGRHRRP
jgi:EAL domain-containing protein (putative c-di-GMP-specific phosphodiesterase class I)